MVTTRAPLIDRGEAILAAALQVFGRDGFTDGNVDEIARVAGVAKPTIYKRFGDKQGLFSAAVLRGSALANDRVLDVINSVDLRPADLRAELERLGQALVGCVSHDEGSALMRLQFGERGRFPELLDDIREGNRARTIDALAGKLAQLATAGYLSLRDAPRAARQFISLVTDDAVSVSGFGARVLTHAELDEPVSAGVDTFLAAFGAQARPSRRP